MSDLHSLPVGIDFGTTHTSAVIHNGQSLQFMPLDWMNPQPHLLRSMIYVDRQQAVHLGVKAVETYLEQDTGRYVRYEDRVVGTVHNVVSRISRQPLESDGPIEIEYDVVVAEDVGVMGRLIQSIKMGLGDPEYAGTTIFQRFYTIEELVSLILCHVRIRCEMIMERDVSALVLGRPVRFAGEASSEQLAEARLRRAAELAGFQQTHFELEPVAAARFYTREQEKPETILVFDFGGGTLDMTILRADGPSRDILATQGVVVGGDDIDSALMRARAAPYFGTQSLIDSNGAPFPAHLAGLMERWQTIPTLSRPHNISLIRGARLQGSNPEGFRALESLVLQNYGFALFQELERAKRALSEEAETTIRMEVEHIHLNEAVTRRELQAAISSEIGRVQRGITDLLHTASLDAGAVDVVVTTGGSSLIPVFQEILKRRFSSAQQVHSDTFGSVAAGLALRAIQFETGG